MLIRCEWANYDSLMTKYHDQEWGVPIHDDIALFESLILQTMQAGLNWRTVLDKRDNFRVAFDHFDYKKVAKYDEQKIESLLLNTGIIRNRLKVLSVINNAKAFMKIQSQFGSFDTFIWSHVDHQTIHNAWNSMKEIPACTDLSDQITADLKRRGFKFVGSTIIYAYLQAIGIVNDHVITCFRYKELRTQER
jgi:DNA-3-methyladenine glycosylase I